MLGLYWGQAGAIYMHHNTLCEFFLQRYNIL